MIAELAYIDATGFHQPDYAAVLEALQAEYRAIYGQDVYLEPDSQDGQWLAVVALSLHETISLAAGVYNSFSPLTALADALSRNVKLNGIRRRVETFSTVDLKIVGQVGTQILNGVAEDSLTQKWNLPATVTIPLAGEIVVTASAAEKGSVSAIAGSISKIATPTLGWQTVTNLLAAVLGEPVETDAQLRLRQDISTAIPSLSVLEGIVGVVGSLTGVTRLKGYENDEGVVDGDGLPAHSIALVVEGGVTQDIGNAMAAKKTPGTRTHGTTAVVATDKYGLINTINFFRPTPATIGVEVTIVPLPGYTTGFSTLIKQALLDYLKALKIGDDVLTTKLYVPANLPNVAAGATFDITNIRTKKNAAAFDTANLVLAFNEAAVSSLADITVIV